MIIVMKPEATEANVQHVVNLVQEFGLKEQVIVGTDRTVVAAIGDKRGYQKQAIERAPGVEKLVPILAPYKRASCEIKPDPTIVEVGPARFPVGGKQIAMIAGPCAVESEEQIMASARAAKAAGCMGLRGGAYKPRTSPYSFQGMQEEGLKLLAAARDETGLAIFTEVVSVATVDLVASYADVLQVGARNMQHYPLLEAVGRSDKPVLLKRGLASTLDEWLLAAEYIINAGNPNVILCERGIRAYEDYVRNTLPLAAVPALKARTHLPVLVDPSHGTGHAYLIAPMTRAAIACGADGVILEMHPDPEHAMSDGAQSIAPADLDELMPSVAAIAEAVGRSL